jgi:hypothetical protein
MLKGVKKMEPKQISISSAIVDLVFYIDKHFLAPPF